MFALHVFAHLVDDVVGFCWSMFKLAFVIATLECLADIWHYVLEVYKGLLCDI